MSLFGNKLDTWVDKNIGTPLYNKLTGTNQLGVNAATPNPANAPLPALATNKQAVPNPALKMSQPVVSKPITPTGTTYTPQTIQQMAANVSQNTPANLKEGTLQNLGMGGTPSTPESTTTPPVVTDKTRVTDTTGTVTDTTKKGTDISAPGLLSTAVGMGTTEHPKIAEDKARLADIQQKMVDLQNQYAKKIGAIGGQGADLSFKTGEAASLRDAYGIEMAALGSQLTQANSQLSADVSVFGTQSGLIQNALGQAMPVQVAPSITGVSPITGEKVYGGDYGAAKDWSNYQFNTAEAQSKGKEAVDMQTKTGLISTQWGNLKNIMTKYGINTDARLSNTAINLLKNMMGESQYKAFETQYEGLKNSIESIMSLPNITAENSGILQKILGLLNDKSLKVGSLESVIQQVINIGNQTANATGEQAKQYDTAGTSTVIGGGNVSVNQSSNPFSPENFSKA